MKRDYADILKDKQHYENISQRIMNINNGLLESRLNIQNKTGKKKKKKKGKSDIEKMLLENTFETESLPKEYLKIMYKEKTGHLPDEKKYNEIMRDMKDKNIIHSQNGQPYEPKYDASETDKENFERFRKEWTSLKQDIQEYFDKYY